MDKKTIAANGRSSEEVHRLNQRRQYKLMLMGLDDLAQVLPPLEDNGQQRSKQMLLTEGVQYVHYLQLCVYQLGRDCRIPDDEIIQYLHWGIPCTAPCSCLMKMEQEINQNLSFTRTSEVPIQVDSDSSREEKPNVKICRTASSISRKRKSDKTLSPSKTKKSFKRKGKRNYLDISGSSCTSWLISPIKSFERVPQHEYSVGNNAEFLSRSLPLPAKRKYHGADGEGKHRLPTGRVFEIITPPSSYKRTIIEDSPLDSSAAHNWENVSVRKCSSPWMPKPENTQGSTDEMSGKITSHYIENESSHNDDLDVSEHFLSSSVAINGFLDSSCSEDEATPFPIFSNKSSNMPENTIGTTSTYPTAQFLQKLNIPTEHGKMDKSRGFIPTPTNAEIHLASPERSLAFSPGVFLTSRRFGPRKDRRDVVKGGTKPSEEV